MTPERIHHVVRLGRVGAVGREPRDRATSDGVLSTARAGFYAGRWVVRDHTATIAALCGPMGRADQERVLSVPVAVLAGDPA